MKRGKNWKECRFAVENNSNIYWFIEKQKAEEYLVFAKIKLINLTKKQNDV